MLKYINRVSLFLVATAMLPATAFAAEGGAKGNSYNPTLIGLFTLIIVLLFVIGMMASTLIQLGYAYRDKLRRERGNNTVVKTILLLLLAGGLSFNAMAQEAVSEAPAAVKSIGGLVPSEFYLLVGTIILELVTIMVMIILTRVLIKAITAKPVAEAAVATVKKPRVSFWDRFHNAVSVEREEDIMLDHDYDGIKELDNSLPPWWKYGFYFTIVVGIIYLWYYHAGGNGPSSQEEYMADVRRAEKEVAEYLATSANNVDENTVTMLADAEIALGRQIFETTCAACHNKDGGGNTIGPNLADQYWLHGGSLKDVFKSIKYGWPDKGMKSWKDDFSPKQLAQLASFVKSLQATKPAAPKDPQGELYIEAETEQQTTEQAEQDDNKTKEEQKQPGIAAR